MPKPNETASTVSANVTVEEIPLMIGRLRTTFDTDKTKTKSWRVHELNQLDKLLVEGQDELARSLFDDMHCSPFEAFMQQIGMLRQEIFDVLKHLDEWMKDETVATNMFNFPASSVIQKDPLGVVLAMGACEFFVVVVGRYASWRLK